MIYIIKNILGLLMLISSFNFLAMHAIHISYGEATIKGDEFYGRLTFYYDDFMLALKNWKGSELKDFTPGQYTELKNDYLRKHLTAEVSNERLPW